MRILFVCDPIIPVPPRGYGGTERIVSYLANELIERGHEVTLIAAQGSKFAGRLIMMPNTTERTKVVRGLAKLRFRNVVASQIGSHDVVHSVGRLDYSLPALTDPIPKVLHFQNPITSDQIAYVRRHSKGRVVMVPAGRKVMERARDDGVWRPIHNSIPVHRYPFSASASQPPYVAFLGRLTRNKGIDIAIDVSMRAGMHLKVGGNVPTEPDARRFFTQEVEPLLGSSDVSYLGELDDDGKAQLLGGAVALLNPIRWEEPFGIVAAESLACGTPVVSFARGELPYLIKDGVTGFLVAGGDRDGLAEALIDTTRLDRSKCRQEAEERFDVPRMVDKFEEVYGWAIAGRTDRPPDWENP